MTIKPTYRERRDTLSAAARDRKSGLGPPHEICLPLHLNKVERVALAHLLTSYLGTSDLVRLNNKRVTRQVTEHDKIIAAVLARLNEMDPLKLAEKTTTKA